MSAVGGAAHAEPGAAPAAAALRDVPGPSAFGGGRRRTLELLWLSTVTQIKLDYRGSVLGYAWTLIRPLALFGILLLVFTRIVRFDVPNYAQGLLLAIVLYTFFQEACGKALNSLVAREATVRRTQFPRIVLPLAAVTVATFTLLMSLVAVAVFILAAGVEPRWSWALFPLLLVLLGALAVGVALGLAALYVRFRDVEQGWTVIARVLFYASPVIWPVQFVIDAGLRPMLVVNPLAPILAQARAWVIDPSAPGAVEAAGGAGWLLVTVAIGIAIVGAGIAYFVRRAPTVAEEL